MQQEKKPQRSLRQLWKSRLGGARSPFELASSLVDYSNFCQFKEHSHQGCLQDIVQSLRGIHYGGTHIQWQAMLHTSFSNMQCPKCGLQHMQAWRLLRRRSTDCIFPGDMPVRTDHNSFNLWFIYLLPRPPLYRSKLQSRFVTTGLGLGSSQ